MVGNTGQVPAAPNALTAQAQGSATIELTWNDLSDNETGFIIERKTSNASFEIIATIEDADVEFFEDMSVNVDTEYTYQVRAYNDHGNSSRAARLQRQLMTKQSFLPADASTGMPVSAAVFPTLLSLPMSSQPEMARPMMPPLSECD